MNSVVVSPSFPGPSPLRQLPARQRHPLPAARQGAGLCLALLLLVAGTGPSAAALRLWTGAGANGYWSTPANWNPAGAPQSGDDLAFPAGAPRQANTNDLTGLALNSLVFGAGAANYALSGNGLSLAAGINSLQGPGGAAVNLPLTLAASQRFTADGVTLNLGGNIVLGGYDLTLRATSSNSVAFVTGAISGTGNVFKDGVGGAIFGGPNGNSFQGKVQVLQGTLQLGKGNGGNGLAIPGDLVIGELDAFTFGRVVLLRPHMIADAGTITIEHGTLDLNGWDEAIGPLRLFDGDITTGTATLIPLAGISQPPWIYTRYCSISGAVFLQNDLAVDQRSSGPISFLANVSGPGAITKSGWGTLRLSGTNDFTGAITIRDGVLDLWRSTRAAGNAPAVTLTNTGILSLSGTTNFGTPLFIASANAALVTSFDVNAWTGPIFLNFSGQANVVAADPFNGSRLRLTGPIQGTGGLRFGGNEIELTGNNTFTGPVQSAAKLLELNSGPFKSFNGALEIGGRYLYLDYYFNDLGAYGTNALAEVRWLGSAIHLVPSVRLFTNGLANLNGHDQEFQSIEFTGGRIATGAGRLYVYNEVRANAASATAVLDGLVQLGTFPQVTFDIADNPAVTPDLAVNAALADGVPSAPYKSGAGELWLSGANTYRQITTVAAGVLSARNNAALGNGAATTVLDGGTLQLEGISALNEPLTLAGPGRGGTNGALHLGPATSVSAAIALSAPAAVRVDTQFGTLSGVVSGTGPLTKLGPGSLQLGGGAGAANTFTGDTIVNEGTLVLFKPPFVQAVPGNLVVGNPNAGFSGPVPATLARYFNADQVWNSITVNRGGLLDLNGFDEYSGTVTLNGGGDVQTGAGTLHLGAGANLVVSPGLNGSSTFSGRLEIANGFTLSVGSRLQPVFNPSPELDLSATIVDLPDSLTFLKTGSGEARLSGANTFRGNLFVTGGRVTATAPGALGLTGFGTNAAATFVTGNGSLALDGGISINETLVLDSTNAFTSFQSVSGSNNWTGPVTLLRTSAIGVTPAAGILQIPSAISGPGGLTKTGPGLLQLWGTAANSYAGLTTIAEGPVEARRIGQISIPGDAVIGTDATNLVTASLRLQREQQFPRTAAVEIRRSGLLHLFPLTATPLPTPTLRAVTGRGEIQIINTGSSLSISNNTDFEFAGSLTGNGSLFKFGTGEMRVTGNGTLNGPTGVFGGAYRVDGSMESSGLTVRFGSRLRGDGAVHHVTVADAGTSVIVDSAVPERRGGDLAVNNFFLASGNTLALELFGSHATGGNDRIISRGNVGVGGAQLALSFAHPPRDGDSFTLIEKQSAGAVTGTFLGLAQGAVGTFSGIPARIHYAGGDGNDVTVTVTNLPLAAATGGTTLVSGGGRTNGTLLPNDCSLLYLTLTNRSATPIAGLRGTLRSLTPGVVITMPESAYPDLAPGARGTNVTPFQIRTAPGFPCGGAATLELTVSGPGLAPFSILHPLAGSAGFALVLDGVDDRLQAPTDAFGGVSNYFTIELWANPTATRAETAEANTGLSGFGLQRFAVFPDQGFTAYGANHAGAGLSIGSNGISVFEHADNHLPALLVHSNAVSGWTHVALVYDNRIPRLYVDGVLVRSGLPSIKAWIHPSASLGGSAQGVGFGNFQGALDELRVWNTALSPAQIQEGRLRRLTGSEPGLIAYYRCDAPGGLAPGGTIPDDAPAAPAVPGVLQNGAALALSSVPPLFDPGAVSCQSGGGACESCFTVTGAFAPDSPVAPRPHVFAGEASICFPAKNCQEPAPDPNAVVVPLPYVSHPFRNTGATEACVTALLRSDCPDLVGVAAYLGTNDVSDPCLQFLGDTGTNALAPFSFRVPAGASFVLQVQARTTNAPCGPHTLEVFGLPCPAPRLDITRVSSPAAGPGRTITTWSTAYPDYRLHSTNDLPAAGPVATRETGPAPVVIDSKYTVTNSAAAPRQFFRLVK